MSTLIVIVIILACVVLGFFVLVQKPKGGGLSGSFGSLGTQVMGVKQSGDIMEKGTWYTMGIIALLCIGSIFMLDIPRASKATAEPEATQQPQQGQGAAQPGAAQQAPATK